MSFSQSVNKILGALRLDGWQSTLGGLGSRSDRGRPGSLLFCDQPQLDDFTLTAAYRNLWLVRRLVEARPEEALREGFGVDLEKVPNFAELNYNGFHREGAFERALRMGELKGGAGLFIGYKQDGGPDALLKPAPEGAEVSFLEVFDRFSLSAQERERDLDSPRYDQANIWCVTGTRRAGMRFHHSRMIRFMGNPLGGFNTGSATKDEQDWGDSVLQSVWADVQRYGVFWQSVGHLMQLSSIGVLSIKGLIQMLASQNQQAAQDRIDLLNEAMSITRLMLLDADAGENYHREAVSFADMPALLQEVQLATAGAFKMPVTKLFGRAPAGMNATGESDMRNWYDDVACWRMRQVEPNLAKLLEVTDGYTQELEFEPLWQESAAEQAATRKVTIDANERLWSMGVVTPDEIRTSMFKGEPIEKEMSGAAPEPPDPVQAPVDPNAMNGKPPMQMQGKPDPVAAAKALLDEKLDVTEFWDQTSDQLIAAANAKLEKANAKLIKSVDKYRAAEARVASKVESLKAKGADGDVIEALESAPSEAFAEAVEAYAEEVGQAGQDLETEIESIGLNPDEGDLQGQQERKAKLAAVFSDFEQVHEAATAATEGLFDGTKVNVAKVRKAAERAMQTGPRGGSFYISSNGTKVYGR